MMEIRDQMGMWAVNYSSSLQPPSGRFLLGSLAALLQRNPGQLAPGRPTGEMEIRCLAPRHGRRTLG